MVFLTSLNILDTGFLDVATRTGQLSSANRVNSGLALQLKGVNFDIKTLISLKIYSHNTETIFFTFLRKHF